MIAQEIAVSPREWGRRYRYNLEEPIFIPTREKQLSSLEIAWLALSQAPTILWFIASQYLSVILGDEID